MLRISRRAVISVALAVTGFGLASSLAAAQQNRCEDTPEGRVCTLVQEIRAGVAVDPERQRQLGLVTVRVSNGTCSGTLLNRYRVLTARHCVAQVPPVPQAYWTGALRQRERA